MKINEVINMMKDTKITSLKPEQLRTKLKKELEVKDYISVKEKKILINSIIEDSTYYEDGVYKIDGIEKYVNFTMKTIAAYTNIELSDDIESDYDILCKENLIGKIVDTFDTEYQTILGFLQMKCEYVLSSNSVSSKIGIFLDSISSNINEISSIFEKKINNFDIDDLNITQSDMEKVTELLGILK